MNSQPGCASTDTHHKLDGTRQSASISLSCCCRFVSAGDGAIPGGGSVGTSGAGGAGEGEAVAAPSNCVKEGAVGSLPNDNTWRRPDDPVGDGRKLSGLPGTAAGLCFFLRNSSLRLAFLLMVDGLFFFQVLVTEVGAISLVSREKEKLEPVVREKENTNPWFARSLQKSKHLVAKGESSPITGAVILESYF